MLKTLQRVLGFAFEGENRCNSEYVALESIERGLNDWYSGYRERHRDDPEFAKREIKGLEIKKAWLEGRI